MQRNCNTQYNHRKAKSNQQANVRLFICVCTALCTTVAHNTAQNRPDNFCSYPPHNHHCSDDVYLREGRVPLCWLSIASTLISVTHQMKNKNYYCTGFFACCCCCCNCLSFSSFSAMRSFNSFFLFFWRPTAIKP